MNLALDYDFFGHKHLTDGNHYGEERDYRET